jgi:hypothetical protein
LQLEKKRCSAPLCEYEMRSGVFYLVVLTFLTQIFQKKEKQLVSGRITVLKDKEKLMGSQKY